MEKDFFDYAFNFANIWIIAMIVGFILSLGAIVAIIIVVIKTIKHNGLKANIIQKKQKDFNTCEYCGSSFKKEDIKCPNCGATQNQNSKI